MISLSDAFLIIALFSIVPVVMTVSIYATLRVIEDLGDFIQIRKFEKRKISNIAWNEYNTFLIIRRLWRKLIRSDNKDDFGR